MTRAAMSVLFLLAALLGGGCGRDVVRIEAVPAEARAVLWLGDDVVGSLPVTLAAADLDRATLLVRAPGFKDAPVHWPPEGGTESRTLILRLEPDAVVGLLRCVTKPEGARVFIDGEFKGTAPLDVKLAQPGSVEVTFRLKERRTVTRTVDFAEGPPARILSVTLPSLTEEYYLQQIRDNPDVLANYVDLAHHCTVENHFDRAKEAFRQGIELVIRNPGVDDPERLWSELQRVAEKQFDYGDEAAVRAAREALASCIEGVLAKFPGQGPVQLYAAGIQVRLAGNRRQEAQELFELAWKKFPGEDTLQRLSKQHRLNRP